MSHDREFLDGLVSKVYEFGGGKVREHLGGIYDFLQKKKIDNLNMLGAVAEKKDTPAAQPSAGDTGISGKLSYEMQKEQARKLKKAEKDVENCEKEIETLEGKIAEVEEKMSHPDNASDVSLFQEHGELKKQLDKLVEKWESLSALAEDLKSEK